MAERPISAADVVAEPRRVLQPGPETNLLADALAETGRSVPEVIGQMRCTAEVAGMPQRAAPRVVDQTGSAPAEVIGVSHHAATGLAGVP
jgi:hypothetical protein